jgi:hypothetical protein
MRKIAQIGCCVSIEALLINFSLSNSDLSNICIPKSETRKMAQISSGVSIETLLINCSSANLHLSNRLTFYDRQQDNPINKNQLKLVIVDASEFD